MKKPMNKRIKGAKVEGFVMKGGRICDERWKDL
jgi:hypothetical protein